jgi:hypothetical protein
MVPRMDTLIKFARALDFEFTFSPVDIHEEAGTALSFGN